jgi:hypothetical protein
MRLVARSIVVVSLLGGGAAAAQPAGSGSGAAPAPAPAPASPPAPAGPVEDYGMGGGSNGPTPYTSPYGPATSPNAPNVGAGAQPGTLPQEAKQPKQGDFDAGGQVRLPNGPDEMNKFATFNWVALDLKARYYLTDHITINGNAPLAVVHPKTIGDAMAGTAVEPSMFGGLAVRADAMAGTQVGLGLTLGYMREGAFGLSEKDYPRFVGDFKPGIAVGPIVKFKLGSALNITTTPAFAYQSGTTEAHDTIQLPVSAMVKLGSLLQVSADLGVFTGDNLKLGPKGGGRISAGASITAKLGPILAHVGAGVASLMTDPAGLYPTTGDSVYLDVNVKYAK